MKNASKLLAMLLAVAMFAAVAFTVSAFEDVTLEDDCYEAVNALVSLDVIKGKTETTFAPDDAVTREQMAALMSRLYTTVAIEGGGNYTPFTDLDDPYYNSVISWCYDAGVINGTTPSTFEPKANIMLQDAVTMACRLIGYTDLTYPLGYLTKGRLIGLLDGLEEVAYDKELTRGETAILLYNALDADGAEVITSSRVEWYERINAETNEVEDYYPLVVSYERNFTIAFDVYNFKTTTFQIVGTEYFRLAGYPTGDEEVLEIAAVDEKKRRSSDSIPMDFEDLKLPEDFNGDDYILTYIDVLYKGSSVDDEDAVILSTNLVTNMEADDEIEVYYKKNDRDDLIAQRNKILINGKVHNADEFVYYLDGNTFRTWTYTPGRDDDPTTDDVNEYREEMSLANPAIGSVFFQEDHKDQGAYAQKVYDLDNDGKVDLIMFFAKELHEVSKITSKGVYTLKNINDGSANDIVIETKDEDDFEKLVILADDVKKNDYVLTYTMHNYTYITEVLEPVIANIRKSVNGKYTLDTGDVVKFATDGTPIVAGPERNAFNNLKGEKALYIVNDRIVYSADATAFGYTPYTYAFIVNTADEETYVDVEDGTVETVYNLIAFINGKAITIPTATDYTKSVDPETGANNWLSFFRQVVTVIDVEDGKYVLVPGIEEKRPAAGSSDLDYEVKVSGQNLVYNSISKTYKLGNRIVKFDADSEIYVRNNADNGAYKSVKRYTMANIPTTAVDGSGQYLDHAVLRINYDDDDKIESYTMVVGYVNLGANEVFGDNNAHQDYRIVLEAGRVLNDKNTYYASYELLNPVTGTVESHVNDVREITADPTMAPGTVVRVKSNSDIETISGANAAVAAGATSIHNVTGMLQVARVIDDNLVVFCNGTRGPGADGTNVLTSSDKNTELVLNGLDIVVVTINEDNEYEVEVTDDYSEMVGKVVRIYTTEGMEYKAYYAVVLPYEWVDGIYTALDAYDIVE